eukprot:303316_1
MIQNTLSVNKMERRWIHIVTAFLYITVIWNVIEGAMSIYFGYQGNDISLFAFGIDSWIEVLSASLVLYHMIFKSLPSVKSQLNATTPLKSNSKNQSILFSLETERKLTLFIGFLLIIFCLFAMVGGIFRLVEGVPPSSTMWGIIIGAVCIVAMFIMYYYKTKASVILNSSTLASDAACSYGCIKLSTVLLIGSVLYEISAKLWWVDAVTAIIIGLLVGYEGYQTVKGAKDKEKFKGGCGCCGATDSGLAKYFRKRFEKELGESTAGKDEDICCDNDEDCCGTTGGDDNCCDNDKNDNCCGDTIGNDDCCNQKVKSYGAVNVNVNKVDKNVSGCGGGDCCAGK